MWRCGGVAHCGVSCVGVLRARFTPRSQVDAVSKSSLLSVASPTGIGHRSEVRTRRRWCCTMLWCAVASTTDGCLPHPMHLHAGPRTGLRRIPCHAVTLRVHPPNPGPRTGARKPVTAACTVGVASTTPRICVRTSPASVAIGCCSWCHVHASFAVIRRDGGVAGQGSPEP